MCFMRLHDGYSYDGYSYDVLGRSKGALSYTMNLFQGGLKWRKFTKSNSLIVDFNSDYNSESNTLIVHLF